MLDDLIRLALKEPRFIPTLKEARFAEGVKVDVAKWLESKGLRDAADEWREMNKKFKNKFKKKK